MWISLAAQLVQGYPCLFPIGVYMLSIARCDPCGRPHAKIDLHISSVISDSDSLLIRRMWTGHKGRSL